MSHASQEEKHICHREESSVCVSGENSNQWTNKIQLFAGIDVGLHWFNSGLPYVMEYTYVLQTETEGFLERPTLLKKSGGVSVPHKDTRVLPLPLSPKWSTSTQVKQLGRFLSYFMILNTKISENGNLR